MQGFRMTLEPIMIPRVVGTPGHARVKQYIIDQMTALGWDVETDKFTDQTPVVCSFFKTFMAIKLSNKGYFLINQGAKEFENIITTLDPNAPRRLVLACHYDSKFFPNKKTQTFIGATDSAVPCAMMITLARDLAPKLDQLKSGVRRSFKNSLCQLKFVNSNC